MNEISMKRRLGIFRHRGLATVELALILPIFVLLIFGLIEFGTFFYVRHTMVNAASDATRKLSIRDGLTLAEAEQIARDHLSSIDANFTVTATEQPALIAGEFDVSVQITVPKEDVSTGIPLGFVTDGNIAVRVMMHKEAE